MILNKKITSILIGISAIASTSIALVATSCGGEDPISKYIYGNTLDINVDNSAKIAQHAKKFLNKEAVRKDITEAEFSTWRTEHLLTNSNFYWELVLFNANRISNSKSGSFSINKWDVSKNKSNDSTLTDISIAIDGNTKENLSGQLSYNFNSDTRKIVCDSSNLVTNFDSWQWESITITK